MPHPLRTALLALCLVVPVMATNVMAQAFPSRPIRLIFPYPPGSSTDLTARELARLAGQQLGVAIVVDNRPGANGVIGTQAAVKAAPDGYTLLFGTPDNNVLQPLVKKLPYDPAHDFIPVAKIGEVPLVFSINGNSPANTLKEFLALAKAHPGQLKFSSYGVGTQPHVGMEMLLQANGIKMQHIPYPGGAAANMAVARGDVDATLGGYANVKPYLDDKKMRILGIAKERQSTLIPNIPTIEEAGGPHFVVAGWNGVFAPAGVPDAIITKLSEVFVAVASTPEFQATLAGAGAESAPLGRQAFTKFLAAESKQWREVVERGDIKVED